MNFIGTEKLLWFDKLFLSLKAAITSGVTQDEIIIFFDIKLTSQDYTVKDLYPAISNKLKKTSLTNRENIINSFKKSYSLYEYDVPEQFKMLSWQQVKEMKQSGLVDFAIHTATHRMLTEIPDNELEQEIIKPKQQLEEILQDQVYSFTYPNGIPERDFTKFHEEYLRKAGFLCAFSTEEILNHPNRNVFRLGRKPAGNDITSNLNFFRLNTSGFTELF